MQTATVEDVQARLVELLAQLGPDDEVVILSNGKPIAKLVPPGPPRGVPMAGRGKGKLIINQDDDEHLHDFAEYMP